MKLDLKRDMKKDIFINMQQEVFTGNVLDIGMDNYGIIYSLYKKYNEEAALEYIEGKEESSLIEKEKYDSCILLFSLNNIWLKFNKKALFKKISEYLKENGVLHIWDINKGYSKLFNGKIKILISDKIIKEIEITDLNVLKDNSKEAVVKLAQNYFKIIDLKCSDNIYYIKCQKQTKESEKGSTEHEDNTYRNKLKVHSQQLRDKVFKGLHK